jgi:NADH-quinone oxidoreductase subunit H
MVRTALEIILLPVIALAIGIFLLGLSRKIMARIHWRYGPPIYQPVIDIIKLFTQKSISHGSLFSLGIILSLAGSVAVILFLPFAGMCPLASSGGLLVILYLMLIAPLGIALSGGEGANPNISIGISRKLILGLGYEIPLLFVLLAVMTRYNTISIVEIVQAQQGFHWGILSWPLLPAGVAYFLILPAILEIRPFDIVQAPQEIASGIMAEYSGRYLALVTIGHSLHEFISLSLFVNLFLGGGTVITFIIKLLVVFLLGLFINAVFPRFRIEQAIRYLWRWPTLLAFVGLVLVVILK